MDKITKMWNEFLKIPFPDNLAEMETTRFELLDIDFSMGGCISTYVENEGKLDVLKINIIRKCMKELNLLIPKMNEEYKEYFSNLHKLGYLIVEEVE